MLRKNNGHLDLVRLGKRFKQLELFIHSQETNDVKGKTFHKQGFIQMRRHLEIFTPFTSHFVTFLFNRTSTCQSLKSDGIFWYRSLLQRIKLHQRRWKPDIGFAVLRSTENPVHDIAPQKVILNLKRRLTVANIATTDKYGTIHLLRTQNFPKN